MTVAEKLRALADRAENDNDLEDIKWRLLCLLDDIDREIEQKRPGYMLDERLGRPSDDIWF